MSVEWICLAHSEDVTRSNGVGGFAFLDGPFLIDMDSTIDHRVLLLVRRGIGSRALWILGTVLRIQHTRDGTVCPAVVAIGATRSDAGVAGNDAGPDGGEGEEYAHDGQGL